MPFDSASRSRPQIIYPQYVEEIAGRCRLEVDPKRVRRAVAKFYQTRINPNSIRFLARAAALLYRESVVVSSKPWNSRRRKRANKQLALAFYMDRLEKKLVRGKLTQEKIQKEKENLFSAIKATISSSTRHNKQNTHNCFTDPYVKKCFTELKKEKNA